MQLGPVEPDSLSNPFSELLHKSDAVEKPLWSPQRLHRSIRSSTGRTQSTLLFSFHTVFAGSRKIFSACSGTIYCRQKTFCMMNCTSSLMGACGKCGILLKPPDPTRWCMNTVSIVFGITLFGTRKLPWLNSSFCHLVLVMETLAAMDVDVFPTVPVSPGTMGKTSRGPDARPDAPGCTKKVPSFVGRI